MNNSKYLCLATLLVAQTASAGYVEWTDWTQASYGASGSATGSIGSIGIQYAGDVTFAQLGTGTNYWIEKTPAPYTANSVVDNGPTASEMVAMSLANITNTVTFSETVYDPIMAIVSQGQYGLPVTYDFDANFTVLSEGHGYWGDGWYEQPTADVLKGFELHAAIQFYGAYDSISWTANPYEYWHGFTFGLGDQAFEVPEPTTALLAGLGLLGVGWQRRRRSAI